MSEGERTLAQTIREQFDVWVERHTLRDERERVAACLAYHAGFRAGLEEAGEMLRRTREEGR